MIVEALCTGVTWGCCVRLEWMNRIGIRLVKNASFVRKRWWHGVRSSTAGTRPGDIQVCNKNWWRNRNPSSHTDDNGTKKEDEELRVYIVRIQPESIQDDNVMVVGMFSGVFAEKWKYLPISRSDNDRLHICGWVWWFSRCFVSDELQMKSNVHVSLFTV